MDTRHIPIGPIPSRILTGNLRPGGNEKLARIAKQFEFPPNRVIFSKDDDPAAMWTVLRGRACIVRTQTAATIKAICGQGMFGLTETIAGIPYRESLLSDSYCTCTRVDRDAFLDLLCEENEACSALLRALSRNYLKNVRRLASRGL